MVVKGQPAWCHKSTGGLAFFCGLVYSADMQSPAAVTLDFAPLRALRLSMHLSRTEMAAKMHIDYATLWRWERGRVDPKLSVFLAASVALGVPMWKLFEVRS